MTHSVPGMFLECFCVTGRKYTFSQGDLIITLTCTLNKSSADVMLHKEQSMISVEYDVSRI